MTLLTRRIHHALLLVCAVACTACGKPGAFKWFSELPQAEWGAASGAYVIGVGDTINVKVYDQESLTLLAKVRSDGRMDMPLVGEIEVAGKQPSALARELEQRLKEFIVAPRVTVNVIDSVPIVISVLGEVGTRGTLTVQPPATLVSVIAQAGGLTPFADKDSIYVLRRAPTFHRIRFTYDALVQNVSNAALFPLRTGDVVVVE